MSPVRRRRVKSLVAAESMFLNVLKAMGYNEEFFAVFDVWDRLLGAEASKARAIGMKAGRTLCVEVDSSARLNDMALRKRQLLKKLNEHFGRRDAVSDIIFELAARRQNGLTTTKDGGGRAPRTDL